MSFPVIVIGILLTTFLEAAAQPGTLNPMPGFSDVFRTSVPVGGPPHPIRAVLAGLPTGDASLDQLIVDLPAQSASHRELCLWVTSRDGRYEASGRFDITGRPAGTYRLLVPYQAKYTSALKEYRANSLAALVASSQNCTTYKDTWKNDPLVPVRWASAAPASFVTLLVLLAGTDATVNDAAASAPFDCASLTDDQTAAFAAFDSACTMPMPRASASLILRRYSFQRPLPAITTALLRP